MSNVEQEQLSDMGGEHHEHMPALLDMMTPHQRHDGPHMRWTARRPITSDDTKRSEEIVASLREGLRPYKDYRVALDQGFVLRHPDRKTKHYHFGNAQRRREARWHFDPGKPTALLYRKSGQGYELEGAMYTAPREMTEEELNDRIPLSVAQWHAHVNLCLATDGGGRRLDHGSGRRRHHCDGGRMPGRWRPVHAASRRLDDSRLSVRSDVREDLDALTHGPDKIEWKIAYPL